MVSEQTGAFRTHQRYLEAFARIATGGEWKMSGAYRAVAERFFCPEMPRTAKPIGGIVQARRSLESAWGTELLLLLSHRLLKGDEVVRVSNNWNVVQAYYALYHATQAVLVTRGYDRPDSHPKTQKMFLDLWGRLPVAFAPWSLSVGPAGHQPATVTVDPSVHVWSTVTPMTCWSIASKALQTTRADALRERSKASRGEKRRALRKAWAAKESSRLARGLSQRTEPEHPLPRLTPDEKKQLDSSTRAYTLIDYVYRLRIRTNYVDSAMFTDGPESAGESRSVRVSLLKIVAASLYASELLLCTAPDGRQSLRQWAQRWVVANVPKDMFFGLSERMQHWRSGPK